MLNRLRRGQGLCGDGRLGRPDEHSKSQAAPQNDRSVVARSTQRFVSGRGFSRATTMNACTTAGERRFSAT